MKLTSPSGDLARAFSIAARVSEGLCCLAADGGYLHVVIPCREGFLIHRVEALAEGGAVVQVSPAVLARSTAFLLQLRHSVHLESSSSAFTTSLAENGNATISFATGFSLASSPRSVLCRGRTVAKVSGRELRDLVSRVVSPPLSDEGGHTHEGSVVLAGGNGELEAFGTNGVIAAWGRCDSDSLHRLPEISLPAGLLRRALKIDELWEDDIEIAAEPVASLGTEDFYLSWPIKSCGLAARQVRHYWDAEPQASAWVSPNGLSRIATAFLKEGRPAGCRISWDPESIAVYPVYGEVLLESAECGDFRFASGKPPKKLPAPEFVDNDPMASRRGSVIVPTLALRELDNLIADREAELRLTADCLAIGTETGFVVIHAAQRLK